MVILDPKLDPDLFPKRRSHREASWGTDHRFLHKACRTLCCVFVGSTACLTATLLVSCVKYVHSVRTVPCCGCGVDVVCAVGQGQ